jgi:hypothetical protein
MDSTKFTWERLITIADILVQKGELTESQLEKIIDIVDIKKIVKNNILSEKFIKKYIEPRINLDEYNGIDLYDIEIYQNKLKINTVN